MSKTSSKRENSAQKSQKKKNSLVQWNFPLEKIDLIWLAIGVGTVALGFALMATGITDGAATEDGTWNNILAVDVAPIVAMIGYCVIIPLSLFKFFSRRKKSTNLAENANESPAQQ